MKLWPALLGIRLVYMVEARAGSQTGEAWHQGKNHAFGSASNKAWTLLLAIPRIRFIVQGLARDCKSSTTNQISTIRDGLG